ncbi:ABC transporter ATP-binding protein [cyanobacterium TDX16]|nr:ABC transporter ATP-binding protein [cyanobacterium TDX16]
MNGFYRQFNRFDWQLWKQFWSVAKPYWFSNEKGSARGLLAVLLILLLLVSGLNVLISYVGRFFQTALANKDVATFWKFLFIYAAVFVIGTPIAVIYDYMQKKLGLYWRRWLTNDFLDKYFHQRAYYDINSNDKIDNPDQRISQDINSFTGTSLAFLLLVLNSIIELIAFTGILWSISIPLTIILVVYAIFGTVVTVWFGKRLIGLNYNQLRQEADFRYGLVHIRNNAESIAFYRGEEQESVQVRQRFREALRNFNLLIGWQRNLGFFTTGFKYFVTILPALVVAPIYFVGRIDFGAISQASFAFTQVLGALSIIVTQFEDISAFAAGINRLANFKQVLTEQNAELKPGATVIDSKIDTYIALKHVTLLTPNYKQTLVRDISLTVERGKNLLIVGASGTGKSSIIRAIAGLWNAGTGAIVRPQPEEMLFLPQRPYMILGSLRDQLLYPHTHTEIGDERLNRVLQQVNLAALAPRVGGFDITLDWTSVLSLGEQQRLAFARLLLTQPRYAILDEATSALDLKNEERLYCHLQAISTLFISVGHRNSLIKYHQQVLELKGNSHWQLLPAQAYIQKNQVDRNGLTKDLFGEGFAAT